LIPEKDKIGVTVVLVTCSYRTKEFVRVGYYVNNDYLDQSVAESPPETVEVSKLQRNILADKPRVTRFPIDWTPKGSGAGSSSGLQSMDQTDFFMGDDAMDLMRATEEMEDGNEEDLVIGGPDEYLQDEDEEDDEDDDMEMDDEEIDLFDDLDMDMVDDL
jgi:histone chaperone ASF1